MAPPVPPLPKMDGLLYWLQQVNTTNQNDSSHEKNENDKASPATRRIQMADTDCKRFQDQFLASKRAWQDAREQLATLKQQQQQQQRLPSQTSSDNGSDNDNDDEHLPSIEEQQAMIQHQLHIQQVAKRAQQWRQKTNRQAYQHRLCLANTICPNQCQVYGGCWRFAVRALGEDTLNQLSGGGGSKGDSSSGGGEALEDICRPERDMIQRCLGRFVASATDEHDNNNNYNFAHQKVWDVDDERE